MSKQTAIKEEEKLESGTMEDYILKRIKEVEKELSEINMEEIETHYPLKQTFYYLSGAKNELYLILTAHSNPQSNPKK